MLFLQISTWFMPYIPFKLLKCHLLKEASSATLPKMKLQPSPKRTHTALVVRSPSGGHSPPAPRTYLFLTHCMPYLHISLTCALPSLAGTETHKGVTVIGCLSVAAEWSAHNSYSVSICQRMKAQPLTHRFIQQTPPEHLQSPLGPHPL